MTQIAGVEEAPVAEEIIKALSGHWKVHAIYAMVELRIADLLSDGPKSVGVLAEDSVVQAPSLYRLLRAMATLSAVREVEPSVFELTEVGHALRSDVPGTLKQLVHMSEEQHNAWSRLVDAIRTGESAFSITHRAPLFEFLSLHPNSAVNFEGAMTALSGRLANSLTAEYDFSGVREVADLGGGRGILLGKILEAYTHIHGTLLDLPFVVSKADSILEGLGVANRCTIMPGSFFETIPKDCDLYILCQVLFNWPEHKAVELLSNIHREIPSRSKLLVVEQLIDKAKNDDWSIMMDLQMMAIPGGAVRTREQQEELLQRAGFIVTQARVLRPLNITLLETCKRD